ncbi:pyridoxal phosphate-dependent aminotransferase [candidate division KSB1 bacterium]|nr:MAG: pyridoxal phosphate-dependent aminotransferase [candidate division KSB1 bacterium]
MPISTRAVIEGHLDSPIRKMFNLGKKLIQEGKNPIDVSLGNSFTEVFPESFYNAFEKNYLKAKKSRPEERFHGYMQNPGFVEVREKIAEWLMKNNIYKNINSSEIIMTHGACGGINVILKTLIEPIVFYDQPSWKFEIKNKEPDEVIILAPYFVEYIAYIGNNQGKPVIVKTDDNFNLNIKEIEKAINKNTKAIILNTPNNPTGIIYSEESINELKILLGKKQKELGIDIYTIEDIPYWDLNYKDSPPPLIAPKYKNSFVVYSWSKSLGLAGERIGFISFNPEITDGQENVFYGLNRYHRNWFVNANAFMQRIVGEIVGTTIDIELYRKKRDKIYNKLIELGFKVNKPDGAFYFFPEIPEKFESPEEFIKLALEGDDPLLYTPGEGFGKGYERFLRISYCTDNNTIDRALNKLEKICKKI